MSTSPSSSQSSQTNPTASIDSSLASSSSALTSSSSSSSSSSSTSIGSSSSPSPSATTPSSSSTASPVPTAPVIMSLPALPTSTSPGSAIIINTTAFYSAEAYNAIVKQRDELSAKLLAAKDEISQLKDVELEAKQKEIDLLKSKLEEKDKEIGELQETVRTLQIEAKEKQAKIDSLTADVDALKKSENLRRARAVIGQVAYSFSYHAAHFVIPLEDAEYRATVGRPAYELLCKEINAHVQQNGTVEMKERWKQVRAVMQKRPFKDERFVDKLLKEIRGFRTPDAHPFMNGGVAYSVSDVCSAIDSDPNLPQYTKNDWKLVVEMTNEIVALDGGGPLLKTF